MSLYNLINGYNSACIFILPMLGRKPEDYPRFRDCYVENGKIAVFARVGGNNRNAGFGEEDLYKDPNFDSTYDDEFDNTYGTYLFNVPEKWKDDFDKLTNGKFDEVSDEYVEAVSHIYPKLAEEGIINNAFKRKEKT